MNVATIQKRIQEIAASNGDPERQHILEDQLYRDVLDYIAHKSVAHGASEARALAKAVLGASKLDFPRWCA